MEDIQKDKAPVVEESLDAKTALTLAVNLRPMKQQVSRRVRKRVEAVAPISVASATLVLNEVVDELFAELHAWVLRGTNTQVVINHVKYPDGWFQWLKGDLYQMFPRLIPDWVVEKWPVRFHEEEVPFEQNLHVCPHAQFPSGSGVHAKFLLEACEGTDQLVETLRELVTRFEYFDNFGEGSIELAGTVSKVKQLLRIKDQARKQ